jgi:hypothetical protein
MGEFQDFDNLLADLTAALDDPVVAPTRSWVRVPSLLFGPFFANSKKAFCFSRDWRYPLI